MTNVNQKSTGIDSADAMSALLHDLANPEIAVHSQRFFKTGPGEYGEGDVFLGIRVPVLRQHVKLCRGLSGAELIEALHSRFHEQRLLALLVMVDAFKRGDDDQREWLYRSYLDNTAYVNNWDLVDTSAHPIVGGFLQDKDRQPLYQLAQSASLWERRIAMISCYHFIKQNDFTDTYALAEVLLQDSEDLMHKAVGWMLREAGKRDEPAEHDFLQRHYKSMPRTMLRYAIEKFSPQMRRVYLDGSI